MKRGDGRATIADVARLAGTSTAVVSYVLNDGPRPVAPATRERVAAAMRRLDYRPRAAGRALRSRRTNTIGLIVPTVTVPFFAHLVDAIGRTAYARGVHVLIGTSGFSAADEAAHVERFLAADVDALLVAGAEREWRSSTGTTPTVFVHHRPATARGTLVRADDRAAGRLGATALVATGHDTVVLLGPPRPIGPIRERANAARAELRRSSATTNVRSITAPYDRTAARAALTAALADLPDRFALLALTDEHAIGALSALHTAGRSVPGDVAVVAIDGTRETQTTVPQLTAVALPLEELAAAALAAALGDEGDPARPLPVRLVQRETT